jgi:carbon monoxide dehydrogenase subunit G
MISKFILTSADTLTLETASAPTTPLLYAISYAKTGETTFRRASGTFTDAPATAIAAPGANASVVTDSFAVRNPNTDTVTVIVRIGGVDILRCALEANNTLTNKGVYDANGQIRFAGSGSGGAGTLDANSAISGLPSAYDTMTKITTLLEELRVSEAFNDVNYNNIPDTSDDNQNAPDYVSQFSTGLL